MPNLNQIVNPQIWRAHPRRDYRYTRHLLRFLPVSSSMTSCAGGDADADHDFDQLDLVQVMTAVVEGVVQGPRRSQGDWNAGLGGSHQADIIAALPNWGSGEAHTVAVPEPAAISLALRPRPIRPRDWSTSRRPREAWLPPAQVGFQATDDRGKSGIRDSSDKASPIARVGFPEKVICLPARCRASLLSAFPTAFSHSAARPRAFPTLPSPRCLPGHAGVPWAKPCIPAACSHTSEFPPVPTLGRAAMGACGRRERRRSAASAVLRRTAATRIRRSGAMRLRAAFRETNRSGDGRDHGNLMAKFGARCEGADRPPPPRRTAFQYSETLSSNQTRRTPGRSGPRRGARPLSWWGLARPLGSTAVNARTSFGSAGLTGGGGQASSGKPPSPAPS